MNGWLCDQALAHAGIWPKSGCWPPWYCMHERTFAAACMNAHLQQHAWTHTCFRERHNSPTLLLFNIHYGGSGSVPVLLSKESGSCCCVNEGSQFSCDIDIISVQDSDSLTQTRLGWWFFKYLDWLDLRLNSNHDVYVRLRRGARRWSRTSSTNGSSLTRMASQPSRSFGRYTTASPVALCHLPCHQRR
jgi:hypothetical protein